MIEKCYVRMCYSMLWRKERIIIQNNRPYCLNSSGRTAHFIISENINFFLKYAIVRM